MQRRCGQQHAAAVLLPWRRRRRGGSRVGRVQRQIKQYWEYIKGTHNIDGVRNVNKVKGFVLKPPPTGGKWPKPHKGDRDDGEQEKEEHPYILKRFGLESKYAGESQRGMRHGQGREEWENGIVYNGSWAQGLKTGLGTYFDPNTNKGYEGQWKNNLRHGWGCSRRPRERTSFPRWRASGRRSPTSSRAKAWSRRATRRKRRPVGRREGHPDLIKEYPKCFGFSVSHTTREPRPNEVNGIHYNFTTQDVMLPMIEANEFLESANVHGNLHGTSKAAVSQVAILDIDIQGVKSVKAAELSPQPIFVFVKAPSMEILEARLRGRGTEDDDKIAKRLKTAVDEIAYADEDEGANFHVVLTNDDLDKCYAELKAIIQSPLRGVAAFRREAALKALAEEEAKTAAAAEPAAEARDRADPVRPGGGPKARC